MTAARWVLVVTFAAASVRGDRGPAASHAAADDGGGGHDYHDDHDDRRHHSRWIKTHILTVEGINANIQL